jgi:hypothetical protein
MQSLYDRLQCPELDLGIRRGSTDYIDFLTMEELTFPVMKGKDCFLRPFIAIRWWNPMKKKGGAQVFFKRFPDVEGVWASARVENEKTLFDPFGEIDEKQVLLLEQFCKGIPIFSPKKNITLDPCLPTPPNENQRDK